MFKEIKSVNFNKSGSGGVSGRIILPLKWLEGLGISQENNKVSLELQGDKIIIKKVK